LWWDGLSAVWEELLRVLGGDIRTVVNGVRQLALAAHVAIAEAIS